MTRKLIVDNKHTVVNINATSTRLDIWDQNLDRWSAVPWHCWWVGVYWNAKVIANSITFLMNILRTMLLLATWGSQLIAKVKKMGSADPNLKPIRAFPSPPDMSHWTPSKLLPRTPTTRLFYWMREQVTFRFSEFVEMIEILSFMQDEPVTEWWKAKACRQ